MDEREFVRNTIVSHLNLGENKAVSYLPLSTISNVLKCELSRVIALSSELGLAHMLTKAERSCIKSGSLHFYDRGTLGQMLGDRGWKSDLPSKRRARVFVRRIARTWFEDNDPMITLVQTAFGGEAQTHRNPILLPLDFQKKIDDFIILQSQWLPYQ